MPIRWTWGTAPDESLVALTQRLEAGRMPADEQLIKRGERRAVWALPEIAGGVLLKQFRVRGAEPLLFLARASRGAAEFRSAVELARLGVDTPAAIGFGERRRHGLLVEAWSLARLVPDAPTVGEALTRAIAASDEPAIQRLVRSALAALARLHRLPVMHRDLHANNLLVAPDGAVLVIDLHSLRRVRRLTREMRIGNLARLLFSMRAAIDLSDPGPLAALYARESGDPVDALAAELAVALDVFELDYVGGRTARCLVNSTLFRAERLHDGRIFRRREYTTEMLRADLLRHSQAVRVGGPGLLGTTPRARVTRVEEATGARIVKEYVRAGRLPRLRHWLRRGRARSAWVAARRLDVLNIPTPQALALVERHDGSAALVTRAVEGAVSLRAWLEALQQQPRPAERRLVAAALGHLVGRLARAGLRHDDLSTKNLLVDQRTPPAPRALRDRRDAGAPAWPAVQLIDLDNLRTVPRHDVASLTRMLTQLGDVPGCITRADRQRFLRAYALAAGRPLAREVGAAALEGARQRAARRAGLDRQRRPTRGAHASPQAPSGGTSC